MKKTRTAGVVEDQYPCVKMYTGAKSGRSTRRRIVMSRPSVDAVMSQHVLFVCTQNRLRSPTAEQVFADWPGIQTASAGLGHEAATPVSTEWVLWSDLIFVMEPVHRERLSKRFGAQLKDKRVICLGIPDDYGFMDPALIALLRRKVSPFLP